MKGLFPVGKGVDVDAYENLVNIQGNNLKTKPRALTSVLLNEVQRVSSPGHMF